MSIGKLLGMFARRFIVAAILVFAAYNIFGYSYYHWVAMTPFEGFNDFMGVLKILVGLILAVGVGLLLRATWRSNGPVGILVTIVICAAFVWMLQTLGLINLAKPTTIVVALQIVLTFLLALGSIWSILWKSITGQYSVEDPDTQEHNHAH